MKHHKHSQNHPPDAVSTSHPTAVADSKAKESQFVPAPDEVARRAYFSYVNQGSQPGHDVQHWLEAEAQLLSERNLTRIHGFHNQT